MRFISYGVSTSTVTHSETYNCHYRSRLSARRLADRYRVFHINANYVESIYSDLVDQNIPVSLTREEEAISLLNLAHQLVMPRHRYFGDEEEINPGLRSTVFQSGGTQLVDGRGACGSYTHVLALLLAQRGFDFRIVQMSCAVAPICHILLEARIGDRWTVLDGLYNLYFIRPDGKLASFSDVQNNWAYYRPQTPDHYDELYRYDGVQYTNWDKIPVVMPFIKTILDFAIGKERADHISIRAHVLAVHRTYEYVLGILYLILVGVSFFVLKPKKPKENPATRRYTEAGP